MEAFEDVRKLASAMPQEPSQWALSKNTDITLYSRSTLSLFISIVAIEFYSSNNFVTKLRHSSRYDLTSASKNDRKLR